MPIPVATVGHGRSAQSSPRSTATAARAAVCAAQAALDDPLSREQDQRRSRIRAGWSRLQGGAQWPAARPRWSLSGRPGCPLHGAAWCELAL